MWSGQISWIVTSLKHGLPPLQLTFCFSVNACYNLLPRSKKTKTEFWINDLKLPYAWKYKCPQKYSKYRTAFALLLSFVHYRFMLRLLNMNCMPAAVWTIRQVLQAERFTDEVAYQYRSIRTGFFWQEICDFSGLGVFVFCFSHKISQYKMVICSLQQAKIQNLFTSRYLMSQATKKNQDWHNRKITSETVKKNKTAAVTSHIVHP